jgi:hypothetical protein
MGRAIDMQKSLYALEQRVKLVEDALEEMIQTRVHHVDLTEDIKTPEVKGVTVGADEEFTPPAGKRKKTTRKATLTT